MTLNISQTGIDELRALMEEPIFNSVRRENRTDAVRSWRNEVQADWVSNFMNRMQNTSVDNTNAAIVNDKTGKVHTVESMVESLKDRVKLDSLSKAAREVKDSYLLSKTMILEASSKKKDNLKFELAQFIDDHFSSHRGGTDDMAVVWALREKYGVDNLRDYEDFIKSKIEQSRARHPDSDMNFVLPSPYMGTPMKADPQGDSQQPMFENMKNL